MKGFLIKGALLVSLRRSFTRKVSFILRSGDTSCDQVLRPGYTTNILRPVYETSIVQLLLISLYIG